MTKEKAAKAKEKEHLEEDIRRLKQELNEEKEEILRMLDALRDDYERGLISKASYEETLQGSINKLFEIDDKLERKGDWKNLIKELDNLKGR